MRLQHQLGSAAHCTQDRRGRLPRPLHRIDGRRAPPASKVIARWSGSARKRRSPHHPRCIQFCMYLLAPACEAIAATTKKLEKIRIVADYLRSRTLGEAAVSAIFLSGRPFPQSEESTLQVGGAALWRAIQELSGKRES